MCGNLKTAGTVSKLRPVCQTKQNLVNNKYTLKKQKTQMSNIPNVMYTNWLNDSQDHLFSTFFVPCTLSICQNVIQPFQDYQKELPNIMHIEF